MITFNLSRYRQARVWISELPDAYTGTGTVTERVLSGKPLSTRERKAAVEILIPQGGRALYGLLGAQIIPNSSGRLRIRVSSSQDDSRRFSNSIALNLDDVRVGLPHEFSEAVIEGATEALERLGEYPIADITFDHAAHGAVGSSSHVFRWLASRLVEILDRLDTITEPELAKLLETPL